MNNEEKEQHRVVGEKRNLLYKDVENFWNERGKQTKKHLYNYVMFLDDKPEVAIERDKLEKQRMNELLSVNSKTKVLDVGCGVGRWGEYFCKKEAYYVGIDGSSRMIERAEDNLKQYNNKKLIISNLQDMEDILNENEGLMNFDVVFVSGVFMYLNDEDCFNVMQIMANKTSKDATICVIESMSNTERLTLDKFYSGDLKQDYSAIYRTVSEYKELMNKAFGSNFELKLDELLDFDDGLQKKREFVTMEHCFIWKKVN